MATGYFLRWRPSYHSFPGPPFSKMAAESNFPPWGWMSNSLPTYASIPVGCPRPLSHPGANY